MSFDAVNDESIAAIRAAVPEFEPAFQDELREEEGELGAFQAMSRFAEWVKERLHGGGDDAVLDRAFRTVEHLTTNPSLWLGDDLAAEFIEAMWDDPEALARMGPITRQRARPKGSQ